MTQSPVNVTYSLEDVLARIERKLEESNSNVAKLSEQIKTVETKLSEQIKTLEIKLSEQIKTLEVRQVRLEEKMTAVEKDITEIKGSQKAQIWTLIGILEHRFSNRKLGSIGY
jgi:predicted  nucleic acid-binding Zn-ribbon protein